MGYYIIIAVSVVTIVFAVFSAIYAGMDKKRLLAYMSAKALREDLDVFVDFIVRQVSKHAADSASKTELLSLADSYSGMRKNKHTFKRIPLVNSLVSSYISLEIGSSAVVDSDARREINEALQDSQLLREGYNNDVKNLNRQLDKRLSGIVGKLFRMKKLEELCDLSELLSSD